ncbi:hypothetical protein [Curtobacterium sp. VKM Ac-1376]|uniref:hypothetical protein n=1 Tax=Curtobacterium sp. VKM Ac-1376 TaxID=123312 RepID=UPI00188D189B|nr:hypothetical protein [Curtobacterium sp. VKM Ac-1376]MBF4616200.1 hypothetical protein [Curtobacterium sp. VKM Ac-1376]
MTDSTPEAPVDLSKPQRVPTIPPVDKKQRNRPRRPTRPRLLEDTTTAGLIWLTLIAVPSFFAWLSHPTLPSPDSIGGFFAMSVWPLGLIAWGAFDWLRDLADYRDALEQWQDDVAAWEFDRRLTAAPSRP